MRSVIKKIAFFLVLAIMFTALTGCNTSNGTNANSGSSESGQNGKPQPDTSGKPKPPMLMSSIANAELSLIDGTTTKIADRKGNVLVLNLWGIWCVPCRKEMPHLQELQEKYRDQGFQVLGLNVGDDWGKPEDPEKIKKFASELKLDYEMATIPESITKDFYKMAQSEAVPTTVVVDRETRVRGIFVGGSDRVIARLKDLVSKVIAGDESEAVSKEGVGAGSVNNGGQKMELKEVGPEN